MGHLPPIDNMTGPVRDQPANKDDTTCLPSVTVELDPRGRLKGK